MSEYVLCDASDGVALVTLNRPERLNAIGNEMGRQFDETMVRLAQDASVRAVVLTGAGRGFCAGADMERLEGFAESRGATAKLAPAGEARGAFKAIAHLAPGELLTRYNCLQALPQPVIAAVNGACAGIGLVLAVMADIRFGGAAAMFTAPFARRGLIAESGIAASLPALVGPGVAADLLLSGRRMLAEEAYRVGLIQRLCETDALLPEAMAYARDIAANVSPRSTRVIKRQLWNARSQTFLQTFAEGMDETRASMLSEDFREGLLHFKEKRPPVFSGN